MWEVDTSRVAHHRPLFGQPSLGTLGKDVERQESAPYSSNFSSSCLGTGKTRWDVYLSVLGTPLRCTYQAGIFPGAPGIGVTSVLGTRTLGTRWCWRMVSFLASSIS